MARKIPELGTLINKARLKKCLTASQLASRCMCTKDWVHKLEGGYIPSLRMLKVFFDALDLDGHFPKWKAIIENIQWED